NSRIHSGAGRIIRMTLRPYSIEERRISDKYIGVSDLFQLNRGENVSGTIEKSLADYLDEIFKSGFPGIRNKKGKIRRLFLDSYVNNIIEHEFSENGFIIKQPEKLLAWMKAHAVSIGTTTNFQTIIDVAMANNSQAPSRPTANNYREALSVLYIIDEVPPFLAIGKLYPNLAKSPKHFMLDPAIALSLLKVSREQIEN